MPTGPGGRRQRQRCGQYIRLGTKITDHRGRVRDALRRSTERESVDRLHAAIYSHTSFGPVVDGSEKLGLAPTCRDKQRPTVITTIKAAYDCIKVLEEQETKLQEELKSLREENQEGVNLLSKRLVLAGRLSCQSNPSATTALNEKRQDSEWGMRQERGVKSHSSDSDQSVEVYEVKEEMLKMDGRQNPLALADTASNGDTCTNDAIYAIRVVEEDYEDDFEEEWGTDDESDSEQSIENLDGNIDTSQRSEQEMPAGPGGRKQRYNCGRYIRLGTQIDNHRARESLRRAAEREAKNRLDTAIDHLYSIGLVLEPLDGYKTKKVHSAHASRGSCEQRPTLLTTIKAAHYCIKVLEKQEIKMQKQLYSLRQENQERVYLLSNAAGTGTSEIRRLLQAGRLSYLWNPPATTSHNEIRQASEWGRRQDREVKGHEADSDQSAHEVYEVKEEMPEIDGRQYPSACPATASNEKTDDANTINVVEENNQDDFEEEWEMDKEPNSEPFFKNLDVNIGNTSRHREGERLRRAAERESVDRLDAAIYHLISFGPVLVGSKWMLFTPPCRAKQRPTVIATIKAAYDCIKILKEQEKMMLKQLERLRKKNQEYVKLLSKARERRGTSEMRRLLLAGPISYQSGAPATTSHNEKRQALEWRRRQERVVKGRDSDNNQSAEIIEIKDSDSDEDTDVESTINVVEEEDHEDDMDDESASERSIGTRDGNIDQSAKSESEDYDDDGWVEDEVTSTDTSEPPQQMEICGSSLETDQNGTKIENEKPRYCKLLINSMGGNSGQDTLSLASPISCMLCSESFADAKALEAHLISHTMMFTSKDAMNTTKHAGVTDKGIMDTTKGMMNTAKGKVDTTKGVVDTTKGKVDTTKGIVDTTKGTVVTTKGMVNTTKGMVNTTKDMVDTTEGKVDTTKGTVVTTKGMVNTTKGMVDTPKAVVDNTKGIMDTTNGRVVTTKGTMNTTKSIVDPSKVIADNSKGIMDTTKGKVNTYKGIIDTTKGRMYPTKGTMDTTKSTMDTTNGTMDTTKSTMDTTKGTVDTMNGTGNMTESAEGTTKSAIDTVSGGIDTDKILTSPTPEMIEEMVIKVRRYQCNICNISFSSTDALQKHIHRRHDVTYQDFEMEKLFDVVDQSKCGLCKHIFSNAYIKFHIESAHRLHEFATPANISFLHSVKGAPAPPEKSANEMYTCSMCSQSFPDETGMSTHMEIYHRESVHQLHEEDGTHTTRDIHSVPESKSDPATPKKSAEPYKCGVCAQTFHDANDARIHVKENHSNPLEKAPQYMPENIKQDMESVHQENDEDVTRTNMHTVPENESVPPPPEKSANKPYTCGVCAQPLTDANHAERHMETYHPNPLDKLPQNMPSTQSIQTAGKPATMHPYKCSVCHKGFKFASSLVIHKRKGHSKHGYYIKASCSKCDFQTAHYEELQEHIELYHPKKKPFPGALFQCTACFRLFRSAGTAQRHVKVYHDGKVINNFVTMVENKLQDLKKLYCCVFCPTWRAADPESLYEHICASHPPSYIRDEVYKCGKCGQVFRDMVVLMAHIESHSNVYRCQICSTYLMDRKYAKRHVKSHYCDVPTDQEIHCDSLLTEVNHIDLPDEIVHDLADQQVECAPIMEPFLQGMYRCDVCLMTCSTSSDLSSHMDSYHSGTIVDKICTATEKGGEDANCIS